MVCTYGLSLLKFAKNASSEVHMRTEWSLEKLVVPALYATQVKLVKIDIGTVNTIY